MNKNTKVALIEFDEQNNSITKIIEIYNIDYAPMCLINENKNKVGNNLKVLNNWYKGRGIPSWRKDVEDLLTRLGVSSPEELLNKSYGLSLSDQYWMKAEYQANLKWKDINFFTNDFKYKGYFNASFSSDSKDEQIDLHSPNNTTDGMLRKAWIIEDGKRILVKGTYSNSLQEPINEWLASQICKRLELDYCDYKIDILNNRLVSKCDDFINENEELVTAEDVYFSEKKQNNENDIEYYIKILKKHNIENAEHQLKGMFLVDYIMLNYDRHLKNFGIIRNVNTLKWEKQAPIFDTGESMECDKLLNEINFNDREGKFFTNTSKLFSEIIKYINTKEYNLENLKDIPEIYEQQLIKYKDYTDISDERITKLVSGIKNRIDMLCNKEKSFK